MNDFNKMKTIVRGVISQINSVANSKSFELVENKKWIDLDFRYASSLHYINEYLKSINNNESDLVIIDKYNDIFISLQRVNNLIDEKGYSQNQAYSSLIKCKELIDAINSNNRLN